MKSKMANLKTEQKLVHLVPPISNSTKISLFVHLLDVLIKTGRYFPLISICLTGLNIFLAVNAFLSNNIGFAILNSTFVVVGLIFFMQMRLTDKAPEMDAIPSKKE